VRSVFRLWWDKTRGEWALSRTTSHGVQLIRRYPDTTKKIATKKARAYVGGLAPSQLVIRNKNGRIGSEATFENDPRRYVG
jgi:hypothetical protein